MGVQGTMDLSLFIRGILVGVAIAVPVGPIGVLCVRRTILRGPISGLTSGLGAAIADTLFGCIAAFGLTAVSDALIQHQAWLKLGGGAFLCAIGLRSFTTDPKPPPRSPGDHNLVRDFMSTFLLTLTNPVTILALAAIFAALGVLDASLDAVHTFTLVAGVFIGSAAWWLLLSAITLPIRGRLDPNHLEWVAHVAGILLLASGLYVLASLAWPHLM
jgi:threonine/homoserine/homoserine lactone efflux protein